MTDAKDTGKTLQLSCYLYEGVFTRHDVFDNEGKKQYGGTYSLEVALDDYVQIWSGSDAGDGPIVAAHRTDSSDPTSSASSGIIGKVITTPEGYVPVLSANGNTYTATDRAKEQRRATVEFYGFSTMREHVIKEANYAGDMVGWDTSEAKMSSAVAYLPYVLVESASADGTHSVLM